jgi:hypothetical protein
MRINSVSARSERHIDALAETAGLDSYQTPPEAVQALIRIERDHLPKTLWEYGAGIGNIVTTLRQAGYICHASDIYDYGFPGCKIEDYATAAPPLGVEGIVTNPPFNRALEFLQKSISEVPYVAYLLRTNFLESTRRLPFFRASPPARIWISSRRLPMMHRFGWTGPTAASNVCYGWFVWDAASDEKCRLDWFDWQEWQW